MKTFIPKLVLCIFSNIASSKAPSHSSLILHKGKGEFSPDEDAHVIADCIKYVLRELPSSPVPASCCKALLEACRTERSMRVNAMRSAICETFPEPNRRLLQRILMMMQTVASHKAVNRMSISAVAACMAPLLLRPLLHGECELDNDFDVGGDGSVLLLQAAAAANHAQAIVITLLEEYDNIFGDGSTTHEPYTDSEESGSESEEITDDDSFDEEDEDEEVTEDSDYDVDEDFEHESTPASSETGEIQCGIKASGSQSSGSCSPQVGDVLDASQSLLSSQRQTSLRQRNSAEGLDNVLHLDDAKTQSSFSSEISGDDFTETSLVQVPFELLHGPARSIRRPAVWGRTPAKKNLSMESIDVVPEDGAETRKLESVKTDSQTRTSNEATVKSLLQDSLESRKQYLNERRLALEKDVARLQEQLQKEMDLKMALEAGQGISQLPLSVSSLVDEKMKAQLEEIAQAEEDVMNFRKKADDLESQFNEQREQNSRIGHHISNQLHQNPTHQPKSKEKQIEAAVLAISSTSDNFSRNKHQSHLDKSYSDKDKKRESQTSSNIPLPLNQQTDAAQIPKAVGVRNSASDVETGTNKAGTAMSRKSSTKGEGNSNSTSSALSKLTHRLTFLKERRSQIATELQNLDKGRTSHPVPNPEQGRGSEHRQSGENLDKNQESKRQSSAKSQELEKNESRQNPNGQLAQNVDKGRKLGGHAGLERGKSESLERGKSESRERGKHEGSHPTFASRTYSR
ncbi:UNVERIFIED_CONTAM: Rho GTPase-activating protein REN1 [Sesamum radiatum]|uniref:Rho GTPase-activating protein REN1 n=1 Tax=Sesamum radiatum TaxID=300843 RepID=A0AAW2SIS3_SESRA